LRTLTVRQQQPDQFEIRLFNQLALSKGALALGGLFGQDVIAMGFKKYKFSGAGFFKPLGSSPVRFNFGHLLYLLLKKNDGVIRRRITLHATFFIIFGAYLRCKTLFKGGNRICGRTGRPIWETGPSSRCDPQILDSVR